MRSSIRSRLAPLAMAGACALLSPCAFADGNGKLGFFLSQSGKVGVTATTLAPVKQSNWVYTGTAQLAGVPAGASVRAAFLYVWIYNFGALGGVTFAGQPVAAQFIGHGVGTRSDRWSRSYRCDLSSLVPGNGSYPFVLQGGQVGGAGLLVIHDDPALTALYQIEIHDGAHVGGYSDGAYVNPWPNPVLFTGFTVDGTAPREARLYDFVGGYLNANYYYFQGSPLACVAPNCIRQSGTNYWSTFDVGGYLSGGEAQASANLGEGYGTIHWTCAVLRVRTSPPVLDTTPPELQIVSHAERAVVGASPAVVRAAVRDESGTQITSVPPLAWSPSSIPPESMTETQAAFFLSEGENPLRVRATDAVGLWSEDTTTIVLDTVWPELAASAPADGLVTSAASVEFVLSVLDRTTVHVVSTPPGIDALVAPDPSGAPVAVSGTFALAEGENALSVTATDEAGHASGAAVNVVRDSLAPALTIVSPPPGAVFGESPALVTVEVSDATCTSVALGANAFVLESGCGTVCGPVELLEGTHAHPGTTVLVSAVDAAGNVAVEALELVLDLSAPLVAILDPADGACFGPGASPLPVTASIDDLTATGVTSTPPGVAGLLPAGGGLLLGAVELVEGSNTVTVSAIDQTLRTGSASVAVVLDTTAPELTILSPAAGQALRGAVDFDALAADPLPGSGVAQVELRVDGALYASFAQPPFFATLDTLLLPDGAHLLEVRASDGVGNASARAIGVRVDNTPPTIAVDAPAPGAFVAQVLSLQVGAQDAGSGLVSLRTRVAGGAPNLVDGSRSYAPPVAFDTVVSSDDTHFRMDGPLMLTAECTDEAGNCAEASVVVVVDNTAPAWTLLAPVDGSVVRGALEIRAAAADPNLASLTLLLDGVALCTCNGSPCSALYDTTARLDGALVVSVLAVDLAGNSSTCSARVTVDNVALALDPATLNLKSKGKADSITAVLEGPNLALLLPPAAHVLELRVPGGSPVPATAGFAGSGALADADGDGLAELKLKFDRQLLIAAIKAGTAAGLVPADGPVEVALVADGGFRIGASRLNLAGQ